ncbi:MAG: hypothetical protein QOH23_1113 [Gaiellaceae bacterium]|nr:hypothetical protein [Gaiellaceae bacterium]
MKISDILRLKSGEVFRITAEATIRELLASLAERDIGALVVMDGPSLIGMVSERDVVRQLHERGQELLDAQVSEIMTSPVHSCEAHDDVDRVAESMTEKRVRHMPVLAGEELVGLVSIGDVDKSRIEQLEVDRGQLEHYITG